MAFNKMLDAYNYVFTDLADPRVKHFFLLSSPIPIVSLTLSYIYFCTTLGPRIMKDRAPYNLKNIVLFYNIFQVLLNTYLFYTGVQYVWSDKFDFTCDPVDYSNNPRALQIAFGTWCYFFTKVVEFLDTIFFVLRKKSNQISFLHVYHHSLMAFCMWVGAKYFAGGHGIVMGTLNSFIHIIMYSYYLIAGLGPEYQKYLWWKKHVTVLQLIQFLIILVHNLIPLFNDCPYPKLINILMMINASLFIHMFGNFFYESYIKGSKSQLKNGTVKNGTAATKAHKNGTTTNGTSNKESDTTCENESLENNGYNKIIKNGKHKDI